MGRSLYNHPILRKENAMTNKEIAEMFIKAFDEAIVGEVNPNANVIPVANISFNTEDIQNMIQDEFKKFKVENNLI